ncbi:MAG TPA: CAP domain-containing protein [Candidatus Limnocylindria bacterium]|nr:CAP domain-containing protein [Candidatus Limnocylindria bacterium]
MLRHALTIALAAAAMSIASPASAAAGTNGAQNATAQTDLISLINIYRANNGLQAVSQNGALTAAAAWMAGDMAVKNYIGHVSSDGRSPTQRMSAFGYPATSMYTGEDLGAGFGTAGAVLAGWQASAAHNAVLLNPNYNSVGIGLAYEPNSTYKWYWAADLGGPGGTVKVVVPPAASQAVPPAKPSTAPAAQVVPPRASAAPRGSDAQPAEETVDPEVAAATARIAFLEEIAARRIAHLFAVLFLTGGL